MLVASQLAGVDGLTNVSKMNETVLADVGARAGLGLHYAAGAALFIADDTQLR